LEQFTVQFGSAQPGAHIEKFRDELLALARALIRNIADIILRRVHSLGCAMPALYVRAASSRACE
jgi:hypothetical protein